MEAPKGKEAPPNKAKEGEEMHLEWPPLESDPFIFNEYFHSVGLNKDVYFKEMISIFSKKRLSLNFYEINK